MITEKDLINLHKKIQEECRPYELRRKKLDKAIDQIKEPFLKMIEQYYDERLLNKSCFPIRKGDVITKNDGKTTYKVTDRYLNILSKKVYPCIICKKTDKNHNILPRARTIELFSSDLENYDFDLPF